MLWQITEMSVAEGTAITPQSQKPLLISLFYRLLGDIFLRQLIIVIVY